MFNLNLGKVASGLLSLPVEIWALYLHLVSGIHCHIKVLTEKLQLFLRHLSTVPAAYSFNLASRLFFSLVKSIRRTIFDAALLQWGQIKTCKVYLSIYNSSHSSQLLIILTHIYYCVLLPPNESGKCAWTFIFVMFFFLAMNCSTTSSLFSSVSSSSRSSSAPLHCSGQPLLPPPSTILGQRF